MRRFAATRSRPGPRQAARLRARRGDTARPDSFARPQKDPGGIYPRKGRGWQQQGEPQFPDLFQHWDINSQWQSWRKGFELAYGGAGGALLTIDGAKVLDRDSFWSSPDFSLSEVMLFRFGSRTSPTGAWTVTVKPRGQAVSQGVLRSGEQTFTTWTDPESGYELPVSVVKLTTFSPRATSVDATVSMVGELIDDSVNSRGGLLPVEGAVALLCLQVDPEHQTIMLDASRFWRYERNASGALVLQQHEVPPGEHPPLWRAGHRLAESMVLSCNCPAHLGVQYLLADDRLPLGRQGAFPQQGGQAQIEGLEEGEGIKRRFRPLSWERTPGAECKHCQAVRWIIGAPTAEPTDMLSLHASLHRRREAMDLTEELGGNMLFDQLLGKAMKANERQMGWMDVDQTLLSASIGDAFSVLPQLANSDYEIPIHHQGINRQAMEGECRRTAMVTPFNQGVRRFNRMKHLPDRLALQVPTAARGDWWTGRGVQNQVMTYAAPHQFEGEAIRLEPLRALDVNQIIAGVP